MIATVVLVSIAVWAAGYFVYGRFVAGLFDLDDSKTTPACAINDGVDYGSTNQLLASLTLLAVSMWCVRTGRKAVYTLVPMVFMLAVSVWALVLQVKPMYTGLLGGGGGISSDVWIAGICGTVLLVLTAWLVGEAAAIFARPKQTGR